VDLGEPIGAPEAVVASNIFHRAVAFGSAHPEMPAEGVEGRLIINGEVRATAQAPVDVAYRVRAAALLLGAMGERLQAGDHLITGSVVQVGVTPGDDVVADFGVLGRVGVAIAP
jgi:2-keto-4-pentenoate hydratase